MSNRQNYPRNQSGIQGGNPRNQNFGDRGRNNQNFPQNQSGNPRNQNFGDRERNNQYFPQNQGGNPRNQNFGGHGGRQFNDRGDNRNFDGFRGRGRGGSNFRGGAPRGPSRPHVLSGEGAIFPINILPGSKAYRYDIHMTYRTTKFNGDVVEHDLTEKRRDNRSRALCYWILSLVMEETNNFGSSSIQVAYDNQNTMYVSAQFPPVITKVVKDNLHDEFTELIPGDGEIEVIITPNEEMPDVDLSDYSQYEDGEILLSENQTLRQVLEIILSQEAINKAEYSVVGNGQLFRNEENYLERGFCTRIGSQKGIRMVDVEEKNNKGQTVKSIKPALVIDFKKSPFYCQGNFLKNVLEFIKNGRGEPDWDEAEKAFKGINVSPLYQKSRVLRFTSFTKTLVSKMSLTLDNGEEISFVDFYARKKKCTITRPEFPAATCGRDGDFPMELLTILPHQRVDLQNIPPYIRDQVHRLNAVIPQERYDNIMDEVHHLEFNNEVTRAFGISIDLEPTEKATVLRFDRPTKPSIKLGGGRIIEPDDDGRFNIGRGIYYSPAKIGKWVILYPQNINGQMVKNFIDKFIEEAKNRGIVFQSEPIPDKLNNNRGNSKFPEWNAKFKAYKADGVQYVMYVDRKNNQFCHGMLKLVESLHKIVTQQVTEEIIRKIVEQNQNITLGNVLHKFNVKNGGTNYVPQFSATAKRLDINTGNILVVGYDVSHPTGVSIEERKERIDKKFENKTEDPSIVGITANYTSEPSVFAGDFFFQTSRKEIVNNEELRMRMKRILEQTSTNRKGKMPEIIVVLRDGVSEGQFKMTCEEEFPALKNGCFDFNQNYKPKFIFIIATKRHHKRFFEGEKGKFSNPMAGSFVDDKVVRPDCIEFFMACHKAIKGTAKFVQVNVVKNELEVTKNEVKHFLHSLCYGHQIVTSPTSLPTPIYIADELATRGSEVYKALKEDDPKLIPWKGQEINYVELTHMLGYFNSGLVNVRFNA